MNRPLICDWTNRIGRGPCWADAIRSNYRLDTADWTSPFTFVQNPAGGLNLFPNIRSPGIRIDEIQLDLDELQGRCEKIFGTMAKKGHRSQVLMLDYEDFDASAWDQGKPGFQVYLNEYGGSINDRDRRDYADRVEQRFRVPIIEAISEVARAYWPDTQTYQYGATPIGYGGVILDKNGQPWPEAMDHASPVVYLRDPARRSIREQAESHRAGLHWLGRGNFRRGVWVSIPGYVDEWVFDDSTVYDWAGVTMAAREVADVVFLWGRSQDWTPLRERVARYVLLGV